LPRTKSALASTRAIPHCQHPTFAHPGRTFSTPLSIFFWLGDTAVGWPLAGVANLLAHALAISLKTTGCRVHQRVFLLNNNKGKGSSRSVKEWLLSCVIVTQISVVFGRLPPQTTKLVPAYFGHQKTCFLHNTSKCFLLLVIPSMPPVECSQQMLGYGGPSPRIF